MAQNIYDDEAFFAEYGRLPRSAHGLDAAPEWPIMRALLPPVHDLRVLDLGSGLGWFTRWAAAQGATSVLDIDLSERMLAAARQTTTAPQVGYERQDLDHLTLTPAAFDVAYSSLTLHYLVDLPGFLDAVYRALVPGARFVCSVEHPIFTAPTAPGFTSGDDGTPRWPLHGYFAEGPRTTDWLAPGVVKQHRTVATYLGALLDAGFALTSFVEWCPTAADLAEHPEWTAETERPAFLLFAATRLP